MMSAVPNIEMHYVSPESLKKIKHQRNVELGQYMTPPKIACFMASLFENFKQPNVRLLDPGAGLGSLSLAFLDVSFSKCHDSNIEVFAYEIDPHLKHFLENNFREFSQKSPDRQKLLHFKVLEKDFIEEAVDVISMNKEEKFTHVILNPPYKKIHSKSKHKQLLHSIGIETVNLYTAFLALAIHLLEDGGEAVAIIPRSFCSGSYYKSFREWIFKNTSIKHIHLFNSRDSAFKQDNVLQENIIIHLVKKGYQQNVLLSFSNDESFLDYEVYTCPFESILNPGDTEFYIRIPFNSDKNYLSDSTSIKYSLSDLEVKVSTGPVVDFRLREFLCDFPDKNCVPLLYPCHFENSHVIWPKENIKKPNAIMDCSETEKLLWPNGFYVVVRRISSKEEKHRIVASIVDSASFNFSKIAFENHLNVFHYKKRGLEEHLAYGLTLFLNSSFVDDCFRSFNGHTQVNATDLRSLKYPNKEILIKLGKWAKSQVTLQQDKIDNKIKELY